MCRPRLQVPKRIDEPNDGTAENEKLEEKDNIDVGDDEEFTEAIEGLMKDLENKTEEQVLEMIAVYVECRFRERFPGKANKFYEASVNKELNAFTYE